MYSFIGEFDETIAQEFELKKMREAAQRKGKPLAGEFVLTLTDHAAYFSMLDIRPAAITTKLQNRDEDAYDFAAHANPATHKHYDRRKVKSASATE